MFFCTTEACRLEKLAAIRISDCEDCKSNKLKTVSKINTFLQIAQYAAGCGKPSYSKVILNYATALCNSTPCKNC